MSSDQTKFNVKVVTPTDTKSYTTHTANNGSLFGGLMRLKYSDKGFNFAYIANDDYGPFLQSVNGLAGDSSHYWALLSGTTMLDVGMGCYHPKKGDIITLEYTQKTKNK